MVLAGLSYLAAADPTALAAQAQAECLQTLEQAGAIATAARARILAAFTAGHGYAADADYSPDFLADPPHPDHQGRGPRSPGLGPPRRRPPPGRGGAGRGNRPDRVDGPGRLRVDRQAPRRVLPGRRR